jgi:type I restriction enzyme S subunit
MSELPPEWTLTPLNRLGRWIGGGTPSKGNPAFWVEQGIPWVSPKDMKRRFIEDAADHITETAVKESSTNLVPEDAILVVTRSGILSHTLPVAKALRSVAINQDMKALIPHQGITPDYVLYALVAHEARILQECGKSGTTVANLDTDRFLRFQIPLPPLAEQRRIVARLDALLARSRRARAELARVAGLAQRQKQAVLAQAFSGEMTQEWREHTRQSEPKPVQLEAVAHSFSYGSSAKSQETGLVPVLRMGNIQNGALDWNDLVYTSDQNEIAKYRLTSGDVLFNRTNSPELVGKTALYRGEREAIYAGYLIRIRCKPDLLPEFLTYCLNSPIGRDYCWRVKTDGVSQSNVNSKKLSAFSFPLPSVEEQHEIVRRIEAAFAHIDRAAAEAARATALLDRLDQATLAKAFRGELSGAGEEEAEGELVASATRVFEDEGPLEQARLEL